MRDIQRSFFDTEQDLFQSQFGSYLWDNGFALHNRRYIGSKYKLTDWIFSILSKECSGRSFADIFAGTGVVGATANIGTQG